ncbi:MAG: hypothetical protein OEZ04_11565, partial [Nitrospinota bacterium]|nr:hypothetical protein [Nitrospinota bacterium]
CCAKARSLHDIHASPFFRNEVLVFSWADFRKVSQAINFQGFSEKPDLVFEGEIYVLDNEPKMKIQKRIEKGRMKMTKAPINFSVTFLESHNIS